MNAELNNIDEKKKRKSFKGMTLMEVIIAMTLLVIVATLVAEAATGVVCNIRTSKSVVKKVNYQQSFVSANNANLTGTVTFRLDETAADGTDAKDITAKLYEAPTDPTALYKNYDKAGNLKYFTP